VHQHPAVALAAAIGKPDAYAGELPIAYVQLKPGQAASGEELKDFAKDRIAERAACPVEVTVIERIPVTAVGKIFKPDLRYLAVKTTYETVLKAAGIEATASVGADDTHGTLARIRLANPGQAAEATRLLGPYHVKHLIQ